MNGSEAKLSFEDTIQLCGFKVGDEQFAVKVLDVQEVIKPLSITPVPLSEPFVTGLINLRGQIVTTISLRSLFGLEERNYEEGMNVIVRHGNSLLSLMVDEIQDVIYVDRDSFEETPNTINEKLKKFIHGVYKLDNNLLVHLNLEEIFQLS